MSQGRIRLRVSLVCRMGKTCTTKVAILFVYANFRGLIFILMHFLFPLCEILIKKESKKFVFKN